MINGEMADRIRRLTDDRVPFVIATVVRARRPTSVRPGDSAVVLADGTIDGFVGGVCAESTVRLYSLRVLETGEALLLRLVRRRSRGRSPSWPARPTTTSSTRPPEMTSTRAPATPR
jgi:xanthine dehydrogenase accessory factor